MFGGFGESLDLRRSQELAENKGVWVGSCSCDEISGGTGRRGRFGQGEEGLWTLELNLLRLLIIWELPLTSKAFKAFVCSISSLAEEFLQAQSDRLPECLSFG